MSRNSRCFELKTTHTGRMLFRESNERFCRKNKALTLSRSPGIFEETTRRSGFRFRSFQHLLVHAPQYIILFLHIEIHIYFKPDSRILFWN